MKLHHFLSISFLLYSHVTLSQHGEGEETPINHSTGRREIEVSEEATLDAAVRAKNRFAFTLYERLAKEKDNPNRFASPLSINLALSLLYHGGDPETKAMIAKVLKVEGFTDKQIAEFDTQILQGLENSPAGVDMDIFNAIFIDKKLGVKPEYQDLMKKAYNGDIRLLNLKDTERAKALINGLVAKATKGMIPNLVDHVNPQTTIALTNALYFKGDWTYSFPKDETSDGKFRLANGDTVEVPMMHREGKVLAYTDDTVKMVSLPYGTDELYVMDVILPKGDATEQNFKLNEKNYAQMTQNQTEKSGNIYLPRFNFEDKIDLKDSFTQIGLEDLFTGKAKIPGINDDPFVVSEAIHKAKIEVDETGTTAAAATYISGTKGLDPNVIYFNANHPFKIVIRDKGTNTIVFMGDVGDPSKK